MDGYIVPRGRCSVTAVTHEQHHFDIRLPGLHICGYGTVNVNVNVNVTSGDGASEQDFNKELQPRVETLEKLASDPK